MPTDHALVQTRRALHAVAEFVLAGAQYRACTRIALRVSPGGFATRYDPPLAVVDGVLVGDFGRLPIHDSTVTRLCEATGTGLVDLSTVYADGCGVDPDERLDVDPVAARRLVEAWQIGHEALRRTAPEQDPILWPEHFDVAVSQGEVNLGVSPGDAFLAEPYAYVGPWTVPTGDPFFDAPFGAARALADFTGVEEVCVFLGEGLRRSAHPGGPTSEKL